MADINLLPKDTLLELLPAAFEPWGSSTWYTSRPPSDESIRRIEAALGVRLPALLIEIARACPSYGGWFGSIGDDYANGNHIVSINHKFRAEGLSSRYVILNHGHDGDCDAWDKEGTLSGGELPIVYFSYDREHSHIRGVRPTATSFANYIDAFVREGAPRCPVQALRRRAKRILAAHDRPRQDV